MMNYFVVQHVEKSSFAEENASVLSDFYTLCFRPPYQVIMLCMCYLASSSLDHNYEVVKHRLLKVFLKVSFKVFSLSSILLLVMQQILKNSACRSSDKMTREEMLERKRAPGLQCRRA